MLSVVGKAPHNRCWADALNAGHGGRRREAPVTVGVAALVISLASASPVSAQPDKGARWLETFKTWPGADRLCGQHVLGESAGRRVEIHFTLYGTGSEPAEVARFCAEAHDVSLEPGAQEVRIRLEDGSRILTVHPVSAPFRRCGVPPKRHHRAVAGASRRGAPPRSLSPVLGRLPCARWEAAMTA